MLLQLAIRNFALIDEITIEFDSGLNVLTGETGAGKSILIDALRLVLGERMEMSQIRDKNASCVIEAVFTVPEKFLRKLAAIQPFLSDEDECLILKREITSEGRSKNYINGQFVNLSQLKEAGQFLVDIHGQYDHQRIFDASSHREFVDAFAGLENDQPAALTAYQEIYQRYADLLSKKKEMLEQYQNREREMDLLTYQIEEIEKVNPQPGESDALKEERIHLAYAEKLQVLTSRILGVLNEGDDAVSNRLSSLYRDLIEWVRIDAKMESAKSGIDEIQVSVEQMIQMITSYQEKLSFDPERLKEIEERTERLEWIARKYGSDVNAVMAFLKESKEKLDQLVNREAYQKEREQEIQSLLPELQKKANLISRERKKAAEELAETIRKDLKDLGIKYAKFECRLIKTDFGPKGQEEVEFFFSPNEGEPVKALAQVASGGEASRTMLAIKHTLAKVDQIPTLIFDEIDSNVGGRLGVCVGEKLKEITRERQVLLITHLPQIASFANRHIKVKKGVEKGKTRVLYQLLEGEARIQELAQMMSGEKETAISKAHAQEMLKTAAR